MTARKRIDEFASRSMPSFFQNIPLGQAARTEMEGNNSTQYKLSVDHLPMNDKNERYYKGLRIHFDERIHKLLKCADVIRMFGMLRFALALATTAPQPKPSATR